ncbi:MAG TPA: class I SAM-dependent methyltransferase [Candidatus Limnocylindrales bacterium]|jgi:hypothetical protein
MTDGSGPRDWIEWHRGYEDATTQLARRLAIVQERVAQAIEERGTARIRVLSMCSGEGRDLIEPVARLGAADRIRGRLVELDPTLAGRAREAIRATGIDGLEVREGDAGVTTSYEGAAPADLVLVCGVFGNITGGDIQHTIRALPSLCAEGATVIWTRHRRPPDLTPTIRRWFRAAGFRHEGFVEVPDSTGSVGVERFVGMPAPFVPETRLFAFVDA